MTMSAALDATRGFGWKKRKHKRNHRYQDEPLAMKERKHGYFPQVFTWRGCRYDVSAVERCWTVTQRRLVGTVERYCFRVRARPRAGDMHTEEGTFEIYQDVKHGTWHMQRRVA